MSYKVTVNVAKQSAPVEPPPPATGIYTVKDYNTLKPLTGAADIDNFQPIKLAGFYGNDPNSQPFFNDTAKFQIVDYNYLKSLQFAEDSDYGSIEQKMRWLVNHEYDDPTSPDYKRYKRPYWLTSSGQLRFGTILFGQTQVKVQMSNGAPVEYVRLGKYPGRTTEEWITFYRVVGGRDWIVDATAIEGGLPTNRPRGVTVRHPVWDNPTDYGDGYNYIAAEFLER